MLQLTLVFFCGLFQQILVLLIVSLYLLNETPLGHDLLIAASNFVLAQHTVAGFGFVPLSEVFNFNLHLSDFLLSIADGGFEFNVFVVFFNHFVIHAVHFDLQFLNFPHLLDHEGVQFVIFFHQDVHLFPSVLYSVIVELDLLQLLLQTSDDCLFF